MRHFLSFNYVSMNPEPVETSVARISMIGFDSQFDYLVRLIDFGDDWEVLQT